MYKVKSVSIVPTSYDIDNKLFLTHHKRALAELGLSPLQIELVKLGAVVNGVYLQDAPSGRDIYILEGGC